MNNLTPNQIENLKSIHDKIRNVLIIHDIPEYGDCIIDEICEAVGIPTTIAYYEEQ
jgi:hypothetical protein